MFAYVKASAAILVALCGLSGRASAQSPPAPNMRAVYAQDVPADRRYAVRTEHPEFADESHPGAAAFNRIMRAFVAAEVKAFRADIADLPQELEPEYTLKALPYFPAPGVVSVRFRASGVLGSGFEYLTAVTVDAAKGRKIALSDVFQGDGWKAVAAALCRKAVSARPSFDEVCDDPDLFDVKSWWFAAREVVIALPAPGKEIMEIHASYADFAAALRPDSPVGRLP